MHPVQSIMFALVYRIFGFILEMLVRACCWAVVLLVFHAVLMHLVYQGLPKERFKDAVFVQSE